MSQAAAPAAWAAPFIKEAKPGTRARGFSHLGTGVWLMYLAVVLNFVPKYTLPV